LKHFINRKNVELLIEQALFSLFNFLIIVNVYSDLSILQVASIGVNITALYASISISRNVISGEFTQSKFPVDDFKLEHVLKVVCIRTLTSSPFLIFVILTSCFLTKTDIGTSGLLVVISVEVLLVDNFRQIQILYQRLRFMSVNLFISISLTYLIFILFNLENESALYFWLYSLFLYLLIFFARYNRILRQFSREELDNFQFVSRKSITVESLSNHLLFYFYNLILFQFNPLLSGEIRIITAWIVNSASSLYITLNNIYTIKLVNKQSTEKEQRSINFLALFSLIVSCFIFSILYSFISLSNIKFDIWLILGTCISSFAFFVHSRIAVLYLHSMPSSKFLGLRTLTWVMTLGILLIGVYFFGELGFIISSFFSCVYVIRYYERALKGSGLI
jgi:hypothetical protein